MEQGPLEGIGFIKKKLKKYIKFGHKSLELKKIKIWTFSTFF
jgi:hypothetical protein